MKIAFIVDPMDQLKITKDSSVALMKEASRRGHRVFSILQNDLVYETGIVFGLSKELKFFWGENNWYQIENEQKSPLAEFDVVLMRKDPPFDMEYLYCTYLLELAETQGARVLNKPGALRNFNEKLAIVRFPEFIPQTIVTSQESLIRHFLDEHSDVVLKPLDGMGGKSVFRLRNGDPNIGAVIETITDEGRRTIMAQRYVPEVTEGDKRIFIVNGKPVPYALARIPQPGESRANLAVGGKGVGQLLSHRDFEIASAVGENLIEEGLFLIGIDVIGDYLTEINITSPTCMVEIAQQTSFSVASSVLDAIESDSALKPRGCRGDHRSEPKKSVIFH